MPGRKTEWVPGQDRRQAGRGAAWGRPDADVPADLALSPAWQVVLRRLLRWGAMPASVLISLGCALASLLLLGAYAAWAQDGTDVLVLGPLLLAVSLPVTLLCVALLLQGILALERQRRVAHQLALTDTRTGLLNRRAFLHAARQHWDLAQRQQTAVMAVLLIEMDALPRLRDPHGRATGDAVLGCMADLCRTTFRSTDVVARLGGGTFVVLLPHVFTQQALVLAYALRARVAEGLVARGLPPLTLCVGVAALDTHRCATWPELMAAADRALHQAQRAGPDHVHGAHEDTAPGSEAPEWISSALWQDDAAPAPGPASGEGPSSVASARARAAELAAVAIERLQRGSRRHHAD